MFLTTVKTIDLDRVHDGLEVSPVEIQKHRPVLVVCYTNHALDQFLEAIAEVMEGMNMDPRDSLIRVGGQTKSEKMNDLLLYKQFDAAKRNRGLPYRFETSYKDEFHGIKRLKASRDKLMQYLRALKNQVE